MGVQIYAFSKNCVNISCDGLCSRFGYKLFWLQEKLDVSHSLHALIHVGTLDVEESVILVLGKIKKSVILFCFSSYQMQRLGEEDCNL